MIASIVPTSAKAEQSDDIARETAAFLAQGNDVKKIPFGVGHNTSDTYREFQSKVAKINAAEKVAKDAGQIAFVPLAGSHN